MSFKITPAQGSEAARLNDTAGIHAMAKNISNKNEPLIFIFTVRGGNLRTRQTAVPFGNYWQRSTNSRASYQTGWSEDLISCQSLFHLCLSSASAELGFVRHRFVLPVCKQDRELPLKRPIDILQISSLDSIRIRGNKYDT